MRVEEQYFGILQNIEFAIAAVRQDYKNMSDYDVMRALEALIDAYSGKKIGRPPRNFRLSEVESSLMDAMHTMCEWRLGRGKSPIMNPPQPRLEPITVDEVILCLKRLLKSVRMWNKEGGRQGYLDFLSQFVKRS